MNLLSIQFVTSGRMGIYDLIHQFGTWGENFRSNENPNASVSMFIAGNPSASTSVLMAADTKLDNQSEDTSHDTLGPSNKYDQEATKPLDKVKRRLAQNREAARKSRLRKKAYVQQLESSRLKLIQLQQELEEARHRGLYFSGAEASHMAFGETVKSGIAAFEMEYGHWLEEQRKQIHNLRTALDAHTSDAELHMLVQSGVRHYYELFRMKSTAAKSDVFYLMSGMWKSSMEQFFLWIGGFRPSELLKVLLPQIESLTDHQLMDALNLKQSCQQAEDALSRGMEKLQQTLGETVAAGQLSENSYMPQMEIAMEKLEALVRFVQQADHLRQETLRQMSQILTMHQAARGLLVLGEFLERLQLLSSLWATRPREPA